jgi:hypothetical protein
MAIFERTIKANRLPCPRSPFLPPCQRGQLANRQQGRRTSPAAGAPGGSRGKFGRLGSTWCQGGASAVHIAASDLKRPGLSSVPAFTITRSKPTLPPPTGVPQIEQKLRQTVFPDAAGASNIDATLAASRKRTLGRAPVRLGRLELDVCVVI